MKKKIALMATSLILVVAMAVGGTLAYLTANTNNVTNTFVVGDIGDLSLKEKGTEVTGETNTYTVVPGMDIPKDPKVSFDQKDELGVPVYVFVTVEAGSAWTFAANDSYSAVGGEISWTVDEAWTFLDEADGKQVYYLEVDADKDLDATSVIAEDTISVETSIDNTELKSFVNETVEGYNDIVFQAYAIQSDSFADAADAWANGF